MISMEGQRFIISSQLIIGGLIATINRNILLTVLLDIFKMDDTNLTNCLNR